MPLAWDKQVGFFGLMIPVHRRGLAKKKDIVKSRITCKTYTLLIFRCSSYFRVHLLGIEMLSNFQVGLKIRFELHHFSPSRGWVFGREYRTSQKEPGNVIP